jgi:hypothetical protein
MGRTLGLLRLFHTSPIVVSSICYRDACRFMTMVRDCRRQAGGILLMREYALDGRIFQHVE